MADRFERAREALITEREALLQELAKVDSALSALGGELPAGGLSVGSRPQVGEDKLAQVRAYVQQHGRRGPVRQADIVKDTGLNSGTVSEAVKLMAEAGEITERTKLNRSRTWILAS